MIEKREFSRFNIFNPAYYFMVDSNNQILGENSGRIININRKGILLETDRLIENCDTLEIEMVLNSQIVKIRGRIVFSRQPDINAKTIEYGILFHEFIGNSEIYLSEYIINAYEEAGRNRNLLRSSVSVINNVVLTFSGEHGIIKDYVISYRKIMEFCGKDRRMPFLCSLFNFMEQDLQKHFSFEDQFIFIAALSGIENRQISELVNDFKKEHLFLLDGVKKISAHLDMLKTKRIDLNDGARKKIDEFINVIKKHAKREMEALFPIIDADPLKMNFLNKLMLKRE